MEKRPTGRPTKLTPALQQAICNSLASGTYIETAAAEHGINKQTLYDWFKRGNADEEPYRAFLDAVKRVEANAEQNALALINRAAEDPKHWMAAAWRLERKHPDRWGRRDKVDMDIGGKVDVAHHFEPTPEFLAKVAETLRGLEVGEVIDVSATEVHTLHSGAVQHGEDAAATPSPAETPVQPRSPEANGHMPDDVDEFG